MRAPACTLLVVALLAGCGGGDDEDTEPVATTEDTATDTAREPVEPDVPEGAVAVVGDDPIDTSEFQRWLRVGRAVAGGEGGDDEAEEDQALTFLIRGRWIEQEAEDRSIEITDAVLGQAFETQKEQAYPREADYRDFLRRSGMTEADVRYRLRFDLLATKIQEQEGGTEDVSSFAEAFKSKYRATTFCAEGYSVPECANGDE